MYNKSNVKDLNSLKHLYGEGQEIYFSCLVPKFDWFEKILSIENIIAPVKTTIIKHILIPDQINTEDKIINTKIGLNNVVRKYILHLNFSIAEKTLLTVYETRNSEIYIIIPHSYLISYSKKTIEEDFFKLVIETKADINFDDETEFFKDDNFEIFKNVYDEAKEKFPEEVIKSHDRYEKNV